MVAEYFVHCKHMDSTRFEHVLHFLITDDIALVRRVLKFMSLYVVPEHLDDLRTGKLDFLALYGLDWPEFFSPESRQASLPAV